MHLHLTMQTPHKWEGTVVPVSHFPFLIGREQGCDLRAASTSVSARHCALLAHDGKVYVTTCDGSEGTFLNDRPVHGEVEVHDHDCVKAGRLSFTIRCENDSPSAASESGQGDSNDPS